MSNETDCQTYRRLYDELALGAVEGAESERLERHRLDCSSCKSWVSQTSDMMRVSASLPQFDVSEQLTQSIMTAVGNEQKFGFLGGSGLLVPAAVLSIAGLVAMFPLDSLEGMVSTGVSFAGLWLVKVLITGARTEETVA